MPDTTSTEDTDRVATPKGGVFSVLVDRPVLTGMIVLTLVLVGAMSLFKLPLTFMGEGMSFGTINVMIPVGQSRSPRETEDKVARPAEELLRTIPGIRSLNVTCSNTGVRIRVELDNGLDPVLAAAEIRDRMQRAMRDWPDGADRYFIWRVDGSSRPLHYFQILTPEHDAEWQAKVENVITPRLEAVDGVGRVDIFGLRQEAIRIWFDKDKLIAHRVSFRELTERLAADNFAEPAGELETGDERVMLRVESRFRSLADIEEFPIRPGLKIKDVAEITRDRRDNSQLSRFNRRFTFTGSINATSGANPVEASQRVRAATEELKADPRLQGVDFRFLFDQGQFIEKSLDNLQQSTFKGGLLALVVLFLFLRSLRTTLAIGLAIPLAMLVVADFLYFTGDSLNILTMTGMTLAVGMVVDNSVVVLENIRRLRLTGLPLREACIEGVREVGLAVTMATLTTIVVFVPVIFMGVNGRTQAMFKSVGAPLSVALLGSLFVALLLLPSGVRRIGGLSAEVSPGWHRWSPVAYLVQGTLAVLRPAMRLRYALLALLALYGALIGAKVLPLPVPTLEYESGDKHPFRTGDMTVNYELPKGLTEEDVVREVKGFEDVLFAHTEEWRIKSVSVRFDRSSVRLEVEFDDEVRTDDQAQYAKLIRAGLPKRPGFRRVVGRDDRGGGGGGAEEQDMRNFVVRLHGRDSEHLAKLGLELQKRLVTRPEVELCEVSSITDNQEVVVQVDRDRLQDLDVSPEALFGTVTGGLQGRNLARFEEAGRDIRLVAQFSIADEPSLTDLKETQVFSGRGARQRLGDLTSVEFQQTLDSINRVDGRTTVTVLGRRAEGVGPRQFTQVLGTVMQALPLPRGYSWTEHSVSRETAEQIDELVGAGALSVVLVFLLMGVLFESIVLPLSILVTIPIAVFGGMWTLKWFHGSTDPMAVTGLILLAGVVVNNGIVLLDCIERLRRGGMERAEAIRNGIRIRLLPIVMTATTTIVGLLPMAIYGENTGEGGNYVSLSITVTGGLALCTLCTAPAVALAYAVFDDLRSWLRGCVTASRAG